MMDDRCVLPRHKKYEGLKSLAEYFRKGINNGDY